MRETFESIVVVPSLGDVDGRRQPDDRVIISARCLFDAALGRASKAVQAVEQQRPILKVKVPTMEGSDVVVEFERLTAVQRSLVELHPMAVGKVSAVEAAPDRCRAQFDCQGHNSNQVLAALTDWARFYGLPLRLIITGAPPDSQERELTA
jgi:hypothetical protein